MRNLKLLYTYAVENELLNEANYLCVDSDAKLVYFTDGCQLYWLEKEGKQIKSIPLDLDEEDQVVELSNVVSMDYVLETQSLCIALSRGDIIVYSMLEEKAEVVGSISSGICSVAWSPDQELLVILTSAGTFILMTKEYDPLLEQDLHPQQFGECQPITVGWGSKETQFHGSEGKGAAKVKAVEPKQAMPWDDQLPRISWRDDGEYFVTSVVDQKQGCRKLRIWSREGVLYYTSEDKEGLEHPLCWRSGGLITCTQQHPNKHEVVFFEKNGLHHGEFTLPFSPSSFLVKEVVWNRDASVLAIWGHEMSELNHYKISLWTVNNYHWYLKHNLDFKDEVSIKCVVWDPEHQYMLHVLASNGQYFQYSWAWALYRSFGTTDEDDAFVAVIDNGDALITPFRKMIVPPPMCAYSLTCPVSISSIAFAPHPCSEDFCAILSNNQIMRFSKGIPASNAAHPDGYKSVLQAAGGNGFKPVVNPHHYIGTYSISWKEPLFSKYPQLFSHFTWVSRNKVLHIGSSEASSSSLLFSVELPDAASDVTNLKAVFHAKIDETVIGIVSNDTGSVAAIQLASGKILKYENSQLLPWVHNHQPLRLQSPCSQFSVWDMNGTNVVLALNDRQCLFGNDITLIPNCTSYCYHADFLVVTASDSVLKCYSMTSIRSAINEKSSPPPKELASQPIERGSRIIASVPGDTRIVLQAPRGNLEVVHPRPLVISVIAKHLDNLQYRKAFDIAKEHRINLNIFYDHKPQKFLDSVESFIEQIDLPSDINLFLVSLTNEKVCAKLYPFHYSASENESEFSTKCDFVCDAVQKVLLLKDPERYFESIIATYCQKTTPALDEALIAIKKKKDSDHGDDVSHVEADKAMKFLLFLVDVRELYKVALGTYDSELAIMVAEKSSMDPKEYLPFLNSLQEMEENYRKYKIDMHLQRYKKALQNISKCSDHVDECLTLIRSQRLYTSALYLFPPASSPYKEIWSAYGDYLMIKMYFKEAGLAYWKSENHEKALKAYQDSGDWQLALCAARHLQFSREKIVLLSQSMAMKLKERQKYEESALLLEQYAQEVEQSISTLIEGQLWDAALNLMGKYNKLEMTSSHLKPALLEYQQQLFSSLIHMETDFCRHCERLKVVRERETAVNSSRKPDGAYDNPDDDLFSETSSVTDLTASSQVSKQHSGSLVTKKSSRSKRKLELKKYRLKEGSPNEEVALIAELSGLVSKVDKTKENFLSFLRMLVHFDMDKEARELQKKMKQVLTTVENEMPRIWVTVNAASAESFGPNFTLSGVLEILAAQLKTIRNLSDPVLIPPKWHRNPDIFLQLLEP